MRALVTGANGLIGANLCRALAQAGYQVRGLVRADSDRASLVGVAGEWVEGELGDRGSLVRAAAGCEVVFHTAAVFAYWGVSKRALFDTAVQGTSNLLEAAAEVAVSRVVLTSSSVVCGSSTWTDLRTEGDEIDDDLAPDYDRAKAAQEVVAFSLAAQLGIDLVAVCPTMTVGPHDTRLVPSNAVIINYLNDPLRLCMAGGCNMVAVEDVAQAHILVAEKGLAQRRYLVGADNLEWSLLYRHISELCQVSGPGPLLGHTSAFLLASGLELAARLSGVRPATTRAQAKLAGRFFWYDCSAMRALGWRPRSTRRALAAAIGWLAASPLVSAELRRGLHLSAEVYRARDESVEGGGPSPANPGRSSIEAQHGQL